MTTRLSPEAAALVSLVPPLRRARGWRLYAVNGRRFLDLWQDGGRGILGAKGEGLGRVAKALIDLGLAVPYPSAWEARAAKAILAWKPGWGSVRFFASEERAVEAAHHCLRGTGAVLGIERPMGECLEGVEPPRSGSDRGSVSGPDRIPAGPGAALAVLPCPAAWSPAVLLLSVEAASTAERDGVGSDRLSPASYALACRSLAEYIRFRERTGEKDWRRADRRISGLFERKGPWLLPRYRETAHPAVFSACLDKGLVISPEYGIPSILPPEFDDGELAPLVGIAAGTGPAPSTGS